MDLETASLVLSSIAAFFVILIIILQLYSTIRPRFLSIVHCWFCGEKFKVPYKDRNSWDCINCEQYNGFTPDGDYNKVIPAQHDIRLNSTCAVSRTVSPPSRGNGLCPSCNINQALKVQQLAGFVPFKVSHYEEEVDEFAKHLDLIYALCYECEVTLARELNKQRDWLTGLKIRAMRGKRWAEKQKFAMPNLFAAASKARRAATVAISLTLFVASLLRRDALPQAFAEQIPTEITEILARITLEIRLLLLAIGTLAQIAGLVGLQNSKDVFAAVLWIIANGIHWTRHMKVSEEFNHWDAVMTSSLFGCVLGSILAAFLWRKTSKLVRRPLRAEVGGTATQPAKTKSVKSEDRRQTLRPSDMFSSSTRPDTKKSSAAEEISHLLHGTQGNVSLPIGRQEKEEWPGRPIRSQEGQGQPIRSQEGIGQPMRPDGRLGHSIGMYNGLDTGIGRLYIGQAAPRRPLVEPSRLDSPPPRNILHETDMFSALSRSSSQSSGFASQCSQHDDDLTPSNPFHRSASQRQHNRASGDFSDFSRPSSGFGDSSTAPRARYSTAYAASSFSRPSFAFQDVFEKPSGRSVASSHAGDDDFADKSYGKRLRSSDFGFAPNTSFCSKSRSPGSMCGSVRCDKDASPNSTFSDRTYRNSFESSFDDVQNRNEMALVCASRYRDDASVRSAGYGPVYLPQGLAPGVVPGYVVNHCCNHNGKLATGMIILGVFVNLILFVSNSGLWPKILDAFR